MFEPNNKGVKDAIKVDHDYLRITSLANVVKVEDSIKTYVNRWIFHQK